MKTSLLLTLIFFYACSHQANNVNREISSEPNKFFITNDAASKRIRELKAPNLSDGECFSDPETKIYLTNIKASSTGNFKELRNQINVEKLENDQQVEYYFCRLMCNLNNRYATFWTTLTDSPQKHNDDNAFICQGVSMEMQNIPGTTLSTMGPKVHPISVFNFVEIYEKLKLVDYKLNPETKARLDYNMNENFKNISKSYLNTTYAPMVEAGKVLDIIAYKKKGYQTLIDQYLLKIKNLKGGLKQEVSKDYFIMLNLSQFGGHLIFNSK